MRSLLLYRLDGTKVISMILLLTLISSFIFISCAAAVEATPLSSERGIRTETTQSGENGSAELTEASRLNAEVLRLFRERKFEDAQPLAERALAIREKVLDENHPLVAVSLMNLAAVLAERDKRDQAEQLLRRAIPVLERNPEANATNLTTGQRQLAALLTRKGDYEEAVALLERAIEVGEKSKGDDRLGLAESLNLLAQVHLVRGDVERAAPVYYRAQKVWGEVLPAGDPRREKAGDDIHCLSIMTDYYKHLEFDKLLSELRLKDKKDEEKTSPSSVINGKAISKPSPSYPIAAKRMGLSGPVAIKVTVDENGRVSDAKPLCGHPILATAGVDAACQARFSVTTLSGKPVRVKGIITYNFVLR